MFGFFSPAEDKLFWSCLDCLEKSEARRIFWRKSDLARLPGLRPCGPEDESGKT